VFARGRRRGEGVDDGRFVGAAVRVLVAVHGLRLVGALVFRNRNAVAVEILVRAAVARIGRFAVFGLRRAFVVRVVEAVAVAIGERRGRWRKHGLRRGPCRNGGRCPTPEQRDDRRHRDEGRRPRELGTSHSSHVPTLPRCVGPAEASRARNRRDVTAQRARRSGAVAHGRRVWPGPRGRWEPRDERPRRSSPSRPRAREGACRSWPRRRK